MYEAGRHSQLNLANNIGSQTLLSIPITRTFKHPKVKATFQTY